jgi:anthranilate synthase component 2
MIDNFDSFTSTSCSTWASLGAKVHGVAERTRSRSKHLADLAPSASSSLPGRCTPNEAGITLELLERLSGKVPILGVCLGHQAIGQAFGGKVVRATQVMHGKVSRIRHDGQGVFSGIPDDFVATRYHSLVVERSSLPDCLALTAQAEDGEIMGVRHKSLAVEGVQFHPEAMLTEHGHRLLENFLKGRTQ